MNIHVRYTQNLKRAFGLYLRLRRWLFWLYWAIGAWFLLVAVVAATTARTPHRASAAVSNVTLAVVFFLLPVAAIWVLLLRQRRAFVGEVDVTLTDQLITRRTSAVTLEIGWQSVRRVLEQKNMWIFVVNFGTRVALYKSDLNAEQRAELEAFLARRREPPGPWKSVLGP